MLHLLYDFHWQGDFIGTWKKKYKFILAIHALTYGLVVAIPFFLVGELDIILFMFLCFSHYFIVFARLLFF